MTTELDLSTVGTKELHDELWARYQKVGAGGYVCGFTKPSNEKGGHYCTSWAGDLLMCSGLATSLSREIDQRLLVVQDDPQTDEGEEEEEAETPSGD